jgi:F-type H+-transporting ATPase subunit delta
MTELATLARPYAVAVYKRARETDSTGKWSQALGFLAEVMQDPRMVQAAANPKTKRDQFTQAFLDLCQGRLDAEVENFVKLLIDNRRLSLIKSISEQFERYRAEEEGYIEVDLCSAYPLDDEERDQLSQVLQRTLGKQPHLNVRIDESLIGGVLIRAGDRVIDASVSGQIQRLAKTL